MVPRNPYPARTMAYPGRKQFHQRGEPLETPHVLPMKRELKGPAPDPRISEQLRALVGAAVNGTPIPSVSAEPQNNALPPDAEAVA